MTATSCPGDDGMSIRRISRQTTHKSRRAAAVALALASVVGCDLKEHPWKIYRSNDPVTDESQVIAATTTLLGLTPLANLPIPTPRLVLRCRKSTVDAAIDWDRFIGRKNVAVAYRIDNSHPISGTWSISTSSTAAIVPQGEVLQFVHSLRSGNELIAQVTTDRGVKVEGKFILTDANRAIDAVLAACNSESIS